MFEFRVTKYDPAHRNARGWYTRDEWTEVSDIGHAFAGVVLTEAEYQRDAYAAVAVAFMREAGVVPLVVTSLENHANAAAPYRDGSHVAGEEIGTVVGRMLRGEFWCRLEGEGVFVHIGRDFYMYVGVPRPCPDAAVLAGRLGLFVEPFRSPYHEERDD